MKNLKKLTKAELISKLNSLKTKQLEIMNSNTTNISNNPTLFKVILKNILYFKSIILKVTLIALIIKLFKRYSILRRLWTVFNTILVTIFGISLVDENVPEKKPEQTELDDKDIQEKVTELFKEDINFKSDTGQYPIVEISQPEIIVNSNSGSDNSLDHYFPKQEVTKQDNIEESINVKSKHLKFSEEENISGFVNRLGFQNINETIKSMTVDKDITSTPNVGNVGLQTPIQDRLKLSPLLHKPSISNLFEDTMDLFDDDPGIDTSGESSKKDDTPQVDVQPPITRPSLPSSLLDQIKSKRLEYGSPPSITHKEVLIEDHKPAEETKSSEEDLNPWKEVKVNIKTGDVHNRFVDIDFGDLRDKVIKVLIYTNDGEVNSLNPNLDGKSPIQSFRWDNKGSSNHYYKDLQINKIYVVEKGSSNPKVIYDNPDVKFLPHYLEYIRTLTAKK